MNESASDTPTSGPTALENLTFEEALERLESVATRLEHPDTPLENAISLYEEGMALTSLCSRHLEQAELRIKRLRIEASETGEES